MPEAPKPRIPGFDGLRAIAVLGVIGSHLGTPGFGYGWSGVALFFVLSGFLITDLLLNARGSAGYLWRFYLRRAVRLLPIYYVLLAASAIYAAAHGAMPTAWPLYLVYLQNTVIGVGRPEMPFMFHTWSLVVEEQFYLVWPVLIAVLPRRAIAPTLIAVIAVFTMARAQFARVDVEPIWFLPYDLLAWGALGTMLARDHPTIRPILLLGGAVLLDAAVGILLRPSVVTLLGPACLWLVMDVRSGSWLTTILEFAPFQYLGRISYGLYLFHIPIIALTPAVLARTPLLPAISHEPHGQALFALIATLATAMASFHFIESPLLSLRPPQPAARATHPGPG